MAKRPYASEAWTRFKELLQQLSSSVSKIASKSDENEKKITTLEQDVTTLKNKPDKDTTYDPATDTANGLMSASDKKRLDGINDFTTGINLLRGTKDFVLGNERQENSAYLYKDGFYNRDNFRFNVDDEGYTVATHYPSDSSSSSSSPGIFSSAMLIENEVSRPFTASGEVMLEDATKFDCSISIIFRGSNAGTLKSETVKFDNSSFVTGKWFRFSVTTDSPNEARYYVSLGASVPKDSEATFRIRKLKIERGKINNPIWSPSPFDIDRINDYTTGINLLRGTRDFTIGYDYVESYPKDGWQINISALRTYKDQYGYTVLNAHLENQTTSSWKSAMQVVDDIFKPNENMTFYLEFMIDDVASFLPTNLMHWALFTNSGVVAGSTKYLTIENFGYSKSDLKSGVWYKAKCIITLPDNVTDEHYIRVGIGVDKTGSINFRKVKFEHGSINNPIWSPSPFDVDYINDETTGVNLIRGSRDFVAGTSFDVAYSNWYYNNGFRINGPHTRYTDENGFSIIELSQSGLTSDSSKSIFSSLIHDPEIGEIYTACFEYLIENISEFDNKSIANFDLMIPDGNYKTRERYFVKDDDESNVWYRGIITIRVNQKYDEHQSLRFNCQLQRNGKIRFRKFCVYKGHINNPVWSASPFDIIQLESNIDMASKYQTYFLGVGERITNNNISDINIFDYKDFTKRYWANPANGTFMDAPEGQQGTTQIWNDTASNNSFMQYLITSYDWHNTIRQSYAIDLYVRTCNASDSFMWNRILTDSMSIPYPDGNYDGVSIEKKFESEIGDTHIATWLQNRAKNGYFRGLNIMDYVDIDLEGVVVRYRIAAIDPYYNSGSTANGHHIIFVPDEAWSMISSDGSYRYNTTTYIPWNTAADNNGSDTNTIAYVNSNVYKWLTTTHINRFEPEWQNAMVDLQMNLEQRYAPNPKLTSSTGNNWYNVGKMFIPSETEVFGQVIYGTPGYSAGSDCQFPIFQMEKFRGRKGSMYWLRTPVDGSNSNVSSVSIQGGCDGSGAANTTLRRALPCFAIG